ncbi:hypothetical protein L2E82_03667 [Cichorium intybus]|uniref:Uncharacterized protein n=1 Tax=Cichorium intybus TaxID=13427 RepID=A0ACB9H478_CICIN|nr:hypothetical protein L2E82_03667 [Cichorium intybus]
MVGVVREKDLATIPCEVEVRIGLGSGLILCNILEKAPGVPTFEASDLEQMLSSRIWSLGDFRNKAGYRGLYSVNQLIGIENMVLIGESVKLDVKNGS